MTGPDTPASFKLAYVPGVTPSKWVRIWNERSPGVPLDLVQTTAADAAALVREREVDAVLLRLPIDREGLHAIPLYTETTVVVVPKDHLVAAADEVSVDDIADDIVLHPLDDTLEWDRPPGKPALERPATTADAIELVAAGVGLLLVPQSLARLHHRRDLTYRPISGAPESGVALSWPEEETTDLMEQFIGIVRGRTVNSTRGRQQAPEKQVQEKKASEKKAPAKIKRPQPGGRKPQRGAPKRGKPRRRS
ncbi:LysR family substrate-binding domain-containing protein [Amycolatopsis umgeniensis]|uniref:DNA-binding transcriptional LysR family regulator n=1 Tax=Amycolatopsis umgeniensis TaxID=336628 RepID=A0A841BGP1_9PSEU|nr:LysR family substrate-binding domain-containing protein [Amycolatopsis umgeniensis]MBB5857732.1 DNA-binding transcriptional LysR family regulator [Amycolatopsis umgeniensis]